MKAALRCCLFAFAIVSALVLLPDFASADSLTGTVGIAWLYPTTSSPVDSGSVAAGSSIVCPGPSALCTPLEYVPGSGATFSVGTSSITFTSTGLSGVDFPPGSFDGFEFTGLTFASGKPLSGVSLTTNISGLNSSDITYGSNYVYINLEDLPAQGTFTLNFTSASAPEPGSLVLLLLGLIGLLALSWRRRKRTALPA
jgi:hypothetical protein